MELLIITLVNTIPRREPALKFGHCLLSSLVLLLLWSSHVSQRWRNCNPISVLLFLSNLTTDFQLNIWPWNKGSFPTSLAAKCGHVTGFGQRCSWPSPSLSSWLWKAAAKESCGSLGGRWLWKMTAPDGQNQSLATAKLAWINPGLPTWTFTLKASLLFKALMHWIFCPLKQFVAQRHHTSLPDSLFYGLGACARDTLCLKQGSHLLLLLSVFFQSSNLSWKVTFSGTFSLTPCCCC